MKIQCAPKHFPFDKRNADLNVVLYAKASSDEYGCIGNSIVETIRAKHLNPLPHAWDFLSIALSIYAADRAGHRSLSYDGWTRHFSLLIAVNDPVFWTSVKGELEEALRFLTTDVWRLEFTEYKFYPHDTDEFTGLRQNSVALFSGGLDSLVGAIDLKSENIIPALVSQVSRGDKSKQRDFPTAIDPRLSSILFNHSVRLPNHERPASQRSRSIVFLSYAILIATTYSRQNSQSRKKIYVSENGYISINPPLTGTRIGSLSTRTTHPAFLTIIQSISDQASFKIDFENRYSLKTKGEMLKECKDQEILKELAHQTTSCGRYASYHYKHCGRCLPCLIRRAAFLEWGYKDDTYYKFKDLSKSDKDSIGFEDVRSAFMACLVEEERGTKFFVGRSLRSIQFSRREDYIDMIKRGVQEVRKLLNHYGVS